MYATQSPKPLIMKLNPAQISPEAIRDAASVFRPGENKATGDWNEIAALRDAASILRSGGLVVYPTETFYALGAMPEIAKAVEMVFEKKGRDFTKPLPLIASDREAVLSAASEWPESAEALARVFWPGPLTIVIQASASLPPVLHAGTGKIAIRVSSHPVASLLARAAEASSFQPAQTGRENFPRAVPAPSPGSCSSPLTLSSIVGICRAVCLPVL